MNLDENILDEDESGLHRYTPAAWRNFIICIIVGGAFILSGVLAFLVGYWLFMMASFFALFIVLIFSIIGIVLVGKAKQAGESDPRLRNASIGNWICLVVSVVLLVFSASAFFVF